MTSQMVMALVPPGGSQTQGFQNWKEMGSLGIQADPRTP